MTGLLAPPALAAEAPSVEFGFAEGMVNPELLSGRAFMPSVLNVLTGLRLRVESMVQPSTADSLVVCDPCEPMNERPINWAPPALDYNGPYRLIVTARGTEALDFDGEEETVRSRIYRLALPARAPGSPKATTLSDRSVEVSWDAVVGHPDLVGYEVRRRAPGASSFVVATTVLPNAGSTLSFVDRAPAEFNGAGVFEYEIRSVRRGAYPDDPASAVFSVAAPASSVIPVPTTVPGSTTAPGESPAGTISIPTTGATSPPATAGAGGFLGSASQSATRPAPARPDTFAFDLPFASTTTSIAVLGRQEAAPSGVSGTTGLSEVAVGALDGDSNRRALLVPIAAGSILCVTALHLRRLSKSLAAPAKSRPARRSKGGPPRGAGPGGGPDPDPDDFDDFDDFDGPDGPEWGEPVYLDDRYPGAGLAAAGRATAAGPGRGEDGEGEGGEWYGPDDLYGAPAPPGAPDDGEAYADGYDGYGPDGYDNQGGQVTYPDGDAYGTGPDEAYDEYSEGGEDAADPQAWDRAETDVEALLYEEYGPDAGWSEQHGASGDRTDEYGRVDEAAPAAGRANGPATGRANGPATGRTNSRTSSRTNSRTNGRPDSRAAKGGRRRPRGRRWESEVEGDPVPAGRR